MSSQIQQDDIEIEDTQTGKFLTFQLEEEFYGIEIRFVTEIIGIQKITEVPEMPEYLRGLLICGARSFRSWT